MRPKFLFFKMTITFPRNAFGMRFIMKISSFISYFCWGKFGAAHDIIPLHIIGRSQLTQLTHCEERGIKKQYMESSTMIVLFLTHTLNYGA
jgi:hypothetical protein